MLHHEISNRLRAGALVVLVEEPDELLAVESAKIAAKAFEPVTTASAADPDVLDKIAAHKSGEGTLIVSDVIRSYGNNPVAARLIREVALQQRAAEEGQDENGRKTKRVKPYSRLILVEVPGVEVPAAIRSDIEFLIPKIPTVQELKSELSDFVKQHDAKIAGGKEGEHSIASAVAGLPRHEAARLFARCWIEKQALDPVWLRKEKAARVSERLGGALTFVDTDCPNVGGMTGLKSWLGARRKAFCTEDAKKFGLPEPKGLLLLGIPGTGKSLTPKSMGRDWGLPLVRFDIGKLFGSLVGQSESQTRQALAAVEACAPCICWIDEIEKALSSGGNDGGTSMRVLGTILTWLQDKTAPVFVVATANSVANLPPELLRKGRFDEIFFVDLPTEAERLEIARIHVERHNRKVTTLKPSEIAKATTGFSGSEIEQVIIDAMFSAYDQDRDVTLEDVLKSIQNTVPLSKTMETQVTHLREWAKGRAKPAAQEKTAQVAGPRRVGAAL